MTTNPYTQEPDNATERMAVRLNRALKGYVSALLAANEGWLANSNDATYWHAIDLAKTRYRAELNDIKDERNGR